MAVENITLNLIPTGETPSIHVAQFDVERPFTVTLKEGTDDFTPTGYDIELQVRKVDNNIVTVIPTSTSGNVVTFNTTEQMTACSGTNLAELQLTKDSQTFATLHFYLVVQRDVLAGGVTSESDIYNLTEQIAEIVPEVIGDDYYDKQETDQAIQDAISEVPIFDPTNYYDKSEVNTLLNGKADVSDLPDMSNYYNKTEVDNKITDLYQIKIVSGSIVHFTDGGDNIPVKSLVSEIVAVETGNGQPKSPDNPYSISGFDNAVITRCGKNLLPTTLASGSRNGTTWTVGSDGQITISGTPSAKVTLQLSSGFSFTPNTNCIYKNFGNLPSGVRVYCKRVHNGVTSYPTLSNSYIMLAGDIFDTFLLEINTTYNGAQFTAGYQIEQGTATTYEPYTSNTYTFTFGQTVYGGHFDNKGNLVVTHGYIASYNGETINEPWISSMDNYVPNTSPSTGAQVVYPLTSPITLSITSQDIPTLSGENNISSNTGDIEVEYFTEKSDGIAELIKAFK